MKKTILVIAALLFHVITFCQTVDKAKLIGTWQSVDDKRSVIVFTSTHQKSIYEGKVLDSYTYMLQGDRLKVDDLEYDIFNLTNTNLGMIYVGRGNTLSYKRIKSVTGKKKPKKS